VNYATNNFNYVTSCNEASIISRAVILIQTRGEEDN